MALKQLTTARELAAATPPQRNRYADFLRAVAILAVVMGHWLMAAVWIDDTGSHTENLLQIMPAAQWLTWLFQVMPLFFLVGGFSNRIGWNRPDRDYGVWLRTRLRRLVTPTVPLIGIWAVLGLGGPLVGIDPSLARLGSQTALVPLWFLAVYVLMVAATPLSVAIWERFGFRAIAALTAGAFITDAVRAVTTIHVGFANYLFVWGAVYLVGHAWAQGRCGDPVRSLVLAAGAGACLVAMTVAGPYDISMVGVPGQGFGNTAPPSAALLMLGLTQIGLALAAAGPMRRLLARPVPWTATVLINGSIMTIYVWHMTAMALTIGALLALQPSFVQIVPGTTLWWTTRPVWLALLAAATLPFVALFQRFERPSRERLAAQPPLAAIAVAAASCVSFAAVAAKGMTAAHPMWAIAALLPLLPIARWLRHRSPAAQRRELVAR